MIFRCVVAAGFVSLNACSAPRDAGAEFDVSSDSADAGASLHGDSGALGIGTTSNDTSCKKMDIVFVIDDSLSMREEQTNLVANFPKFFDVLNKLTSKSGTPIDYRIAVTTTGVDINVTKEINGKTQPTEYQKGDNGKFRSTSNMTRPWLERSDANVSSTFETIAQVGLAGPGWEQPLESSMRALGARLADTNKGFLRDDALLGIVYLTDEDDCSTKKLDVTQPQNAACSTLSAPEPTSTYVAFFDTLKQGRARWATAVVAGATKCVSSFGNAIEATRLKGFAGEVGKSALFSSICDGDLSVGLGNVLTTFDEACKNFEIPR